LNPGKWMMGVYEEIAAHNGMAVFYDNAERIYFG
jgi:hypothetical protein